MTEHRSGWYRPDRTTESVDKRMKWHFFDDGEAWSLCGMLRFEKMPRLRIGTILAAEALCSLCGRMVDAGDAAELRRSLSDRWRR